MTFISSLLRLWKEDVRNGDLPKIGVLLLLLESSANETTHLIRQKA